MRVGWSAFLVGVGAILYSLTDASLGFLNTDAVALALMVVGDLGLLLALAGQSIWSRRARRAERGG